MDDGNVHYEDKDGYTRHDDVNYDDEDIHVYDDKDIHVDDYYDKFQCDKWLGTCCLLWKLRKEFVTWLSSWLGCGVEFCI